MCVWQVVAVHPGSAKNTFSYLNNMGHCPHFIWDPYSGETIQALRLLEAGSLFGKDVNQGGYPLIQVAVVSGRETPFTDSPLLGGGSIFKALRHVGVPEVWPKGPPASEGLTQTRTEGVLKAGHYSIDQIDPGYLGIGPIDIGRLMRHEPLPEEVDVPDGDEELPQGEDWYPDWDAWSDES